MKTNCAKKWRSKGLTRAWARSLARGARALPLSVLLLASCSTVTPVNVEPKVASYDGTNQNSGVLYFHHRPDGSIDWALLTTHAKDRYQRLARIYGKKFIPPLQPLDGLEGTATNTWVIDGEHFAAFATMNRWRVEGK